MENKHEWQNRFENMYIAMIRVTQPVSTSALLMRIVNEGKDLISGKYASLFVQKNDTVHRVYPTDPILYTVKPRKNGIMYSALHNRTSYMLKAKTINKIHPSYKALQAGNDITVPLYADGQALGVLSILSHPGKEFSKTDLTLLKLYAQFATEVIKKVASYETLQKGLSQRDEFISLASHEIKNPLTTLKVYSHLLKNRSMSAPKKKLIVDKISSSTDRIEKLVNELLTIKQIKKGAFEYNLKAFAIKKVLEQCVDDFIVSGHPQSIEKSYQITQKSYIWGDPDKLIQVITNILNNASKFSPISSKIILAAKSFGKNYIIKITDQGKGISKKDLPHIFERYYTGKDTKKSGLGLGLFLAKQIICDHKGTISVKSSLKKGTTFTITVPRYIYDKSRTTSTSRTG